MMSVPDIDLILKTAIHAAQEAGKVVYSGFSELQTIMDKGRHDVVTSTDLASEKIILDILKSAFHQHSVLSEEQGMADRHSDYCWIIDPLDGTSNFVTGNPYFTVSVGLKYKDKMICGVVFNPVTGELYHASLNQGAFLNNQRIQTSARSQPADSFIAVAWAAEEEKISEGIKMLASLSRQCRRTVVNFAPALDLCNIARGRLDGLIDNGSTPEDHAAASLILSEAGGKCENLYRPLWNVMKTGIVASNGTVTPAFIKSLFVNDLVS